jgi:iron complex outermembrane receptor protein
MSGKRSALNSLTSALTQVLLITAAGTSVAAAQESTALQEVIVTAQKREQNLQDVPVSISVMSGKKLNELQITDLRALQGYIPNLAILNSGVNPVVYIRGFGSGPNNVAFDQDVSVYWDGVYGGRGAQFTAQFFDLERMEVLRGPQGALFGKNTAAGAISIISARPTTIPTGAATVSYNFEQKGFEASGYVSGPITDTLSGRLAVRLVDRDGFLKNLARGEREPQIEQELVRASFLWRPSEDLDVHFKAEHARHYLRGGVTHSGSLTAPTSFTDVRYVSDPYGPSPVPEESGITSDNISLTANYALGDHTLTSVSGYSAFKTKRLSAYDEFNPDRTIQPNGGNALYANGFPEDFEQFSEELRLASPTGQRLEYIVGLYYDYSDYHLINNTYYRGLGGGTITGYHRNDFYQKGWSYSVFGQGTFHVTDSLRAIGSLRYSETLKKANFTSRLVSGVRLNPEGAARGKLTEDYVDPSFTVQYDVTDAIMAYATAARGSKSGGFVSNTSSTTDASFQFRPERSTNYEVGLKSTFLEGRLVANVAAFHMEFKDLQQSTYDPDRRTFFTRNAARASSEGVEADVQWLPIDTLQLSLGVAYLDAKFDDYPGAPCLTRETLAQCNSADPASLAAHNLKGVPLQFAPKWSGNVGARHTLMLPNDLRVVSSVTALFRSKYFIADGYDPVWGRQDGWVKLDARVQVGPANERWNVALVGRNLTDERTAGAAIRFPASITTTTRAIFWMDEYRSIAIEGTYRFW